MLHRSSNHRDTSPNNHYENDVRYVFQLCWWILKPIGAYPFVYSNVSKLERAMSILLLIVCTFVIQFILVPMGNYVLFFEKDMDKRIKLIGPMTFCVLAIVKYTYLCLKGSAFERCIKHIEKDWRILKNRDHRNMMVNHITMGHNLIKICAMFLYIGSLFFHTFMPFLSTMKTNENVTIRPLAYPGYEAFFDVQKSPTYEIVYCIHCVYMIMIGNITIAPYSLATVFASHACGQMKVQILRLENLANEWLPRIKCQEDALMVVVRDHAEILRFMKNVGEALHEICLMEVIISSILICFAEYYCMMELRNNDLIAVLTYVVLLTFFIFIIFMYCYLGELLLEQTEILHQGNNIAIASYETGWYNIPGREARSIVLLLAISKYPPKLTAGKIIDLSLNTFGVVLKSSMVYLNMLRTITEV